MKCISKYKWFALIGIGSFLFCWLVFGKEDEFEEYSYPLEVIDNEIRVTETGEILYRFIPVDGGTMTFSYCDSGKKDGNEDKVFNTYLRRIPSMLIGETPVTLRLWDYVMENQYDNSEDNILKYYHVYKDGINAYGWNKFIEKLGNLCNRKFRLPSNEEWEYAARGGMKSKNYVYAGSNNIDEVAFYKANSHEDMIFRSGKQKKANELGLYDMSGNVYELTTTPLPELLPSLRPLQKVDSILSKGISRGGDWTSDTLECQICNITAHIRVISGARLILIND